jgi:hypothetical protein
VKNIMQRSIGDYFRTRPEELEKAFLAFERLQAIEGNTVQICSHEECSYPEDDDDY